MGRKRKDPNGEILSERIVVNVTPTVKKEFEALTKILGTNANQFLTDFILQSIAPYQKKIEAVLELDNEYETKFNSILAQDWKGGISDD